MLGPDFRVITTGTPVALSSAVAPDSGGTAANGLAGPAFTARSRPSILAVDDESSNFELFSDIFGNDYDMFFATEGNAALKLAAVKSPDMILLDVLMPGMDGYEVYRRLKMDKATSGISVIFVTAVGDAHSEIRGLELGAVDYIAKPIRPETTRARVNNHVRLKSAQDKLRRVSELEHSMREKRIEALSHIAGGLAHEISNPLTIILDGAKNLHLLATGKAPLVATDVQMACETIVRTSDRAIKILHGLRGLADGVDGNPMELASVRQIAVECIALQDARFRVHKIDVRVTIDARAPRVRCREIQIGQILTNLLNNAFDAIVHSNCAERWVSLSSSVRDGYLVIDVIDSGPGIVSSVRSRLMDPFFTTKQAGAGMGVGLSLSRAIARDHGGDLILCDDTDRTRFRLTLPASSQVTPAATAPLPPSAGARLRGATILVVDDEPALRGTFRKWLLAIGCGQVLSAENGEAALAIIRTEKIDLMITDLHMPIMNGATLLRQIADMGRFIPSVLFLSISGDIKAEALYALGVEAFISKPFDRDKLVETMGRALGEQQAQWVAPMHVAPAQSIEISRNGADTGERGQEVRLGKGGFSARYRSPLSLGPITFRCYYPKVGRDMTGQGIVRWRSEADKTVGIEFIFLDDGCRAWVQRAIAAANSQSFIPTFGPRQ